MRKKRNEKREREKKREQTLDSVGEDFRLRLLADLGGVNTTRGEEGDVGESRLEEGDGER